jgi:hypothetical protein
MTNELRTLSQAEIEDVSGGFVCAGLCVLGGIIASIGLFVSGVKVGEAIGKATN